MLIIPDDPIFTPVFDEYISAIRPRNDDDVERAVDRVRRAVSAARRHGQSERDWIKAASDWAHYGDC